MFKIKRLLLISGILLIAKILYSQQPTSFSYTATNLSGTLLGQVKLNSVNCISSDWIAAFDSNGICCGANQVIVNSGTAYINLTIYGDDLGTSVDEGINANEPFFLRLFDSTSGIIHDYGVSFNQWINNNGAPMPAYDDPTTIFNFTTNSQVSFTLNQNEFCLNSPIYQLIEGTPNGGTYFGLGVDNGFFDPIISGPGFFEIAYYYGNDTITDTIEVYNLPDITIVSNSVFCDNDEPIILNSNTNGGVFTGQGVTSNIFNPNAVGVGTYQISYSLTDSNNCIQNTDQIVEVYNSPPAPLINEVNNCLEVSNSNTIQWYDSNLNPIIGETNSIFCPEYSGDYYVTESNANCSSTSLPYNFDFVTNAAAELYVEKQKIIAIYDMLGNKVNHQPQESKLYIYIYSDGSTQKLIFTEL